MRRTAFLTLLLALGGCGYNTWWNPPLVGGYNPNRPAPGSENVDRVLGNDPAIDPIGVETGNIWPGPLPPAPTLADLETNGSSGAERPVPGSPLFTPSVGSSTPPGNALSGLPPTQVAPPSSSYAAPAAAPPTAVPGGQAFQTPGGTSVVTGGGPGYKTAVQPGGGQSIIVPNGNGTSTIIHPDGKIETVPTPK